MSASRPGRVQLTKHHGAGNDFLVLVDRSGDTALDPVLVVALCDRHRGVGADGVIRVAPSASGDGTSPELVMELRNADGSPAEVSGNGLRCLAQAAVDAGLVRPPTFSVRTPGGDRTVEYETIGERRGAARARVGMGVPRLGPHEELDSGPAPAIDDLKVAQWVDTGNPHLVVVGSLREGVPVAEAGAVLAGRRPGGANVEFVTVDAGGEALTLRVWERGAGETLACGSGSVAAAAVTRSAGLTGDRVVVDNPGGPLEVAFEGAEAWLGGPVHKVADLEIDPDVLLASLR